MRLTAFILCVCLLSCSRENDVPRGILEPKKMQAVFWDFIRADVYATDFIRKDTSKNPSIENMKLQDRIFKLHHTSRDEFYKSYTWYSNHKELMTKIMDSIIAKQQRAAILLK